MLLSKLHLDPGETILLEVRRHWIVFLGPTIVFTLFALVPPVIYILILIFAVPEAVNFVLNKFAFLLFAYSLWLLFLWMGYFIHWTNYYLDVWYITEKRIIDVDQKGIFHREISNIRFDKIQDITIEVKGVIATFLNFGDLKVQTAGENSSSFLIHNAARPEEVRKIIFAHHNKQAEKMYKVEPQSNGQV